MSLSKSNYLSLDNDASSKISNLPIVAQNVLPKPKDKDTAWFICRRFQMKRQTFFILTTAMLLAAIFFERFCFIVVVYKSKYYGYVLILLVIAINCVFNLILFKINPGNQKHKKKLHSIFKLVRKPKLGCGVVTIIG